MLSRIPPNRRPLVILGIIIVLVALWVAFRPELLFVKKPVNEDLPGATSFYSTPHSVANIASVPSPRNFVQ